MNNFFTNGAGWRHFWSPAAVLAVRGEDALSFLQGQFSQDLCPKAIGQTAAYGLCLNHRGRVLADSFALVAGPAEVWLFSYFSAAEQIAAHLEKHVIADDVTVENCTPGWRGLALGGTGAAAWLRTRSGAATPPAAGAFARVGDGFVFHGRRGAAESWEWLVPASSSVFAASGGQLTEISASELEQMRLAAGVPAVPTDIGPADLPHEGGLDTVAVSSTKGCYVGQEVMARLRTGKIRRRLARVTGPGTPPPGGTALFQAGKKIGEIRSAAGRADGFLGLALLTLLSLDPAAPVALRPDALAEIRLLDTPAEHPSA